MLHAQVHEPSLDLRGHLVRTRTWHLRLIHQPGQPMGRVAPQPRCTDCRVTPKRSATSVTGTPSLITSNTADKRCSTRPSSTITTKPPVDYVDQKHSPQARTVSQRCRSH